MNKNTKRITITWYTRPENMRILVIPLSLLRFGLFLVAFALLIPGGGLAWLILVPANDSAANTKCDSHEELAATETAKSSRFSGTPKAVATVASTGSAGGSTPGYVERQGTIHSEAKPSHASGPASEEEEPKQELEPESEQELEQEPGEDQPKASSQAPKVDISRVDTDFDAGNNLSVQVEIRNQGKAEVAGVAWAVATFISVEGSRILVPSHAQIQSENVAALQNKPFGIPFKAKVRTIKSFLFEGPTDIDGTFRQVTIVALPSPVTAKPNAGPASGQALPATPEVRTVKIQEQ